jgi:hypothetical protein
MKYIKYLLIVMLILSFALVSCKKNIITGPGDGGAIVGTWNVVDAVIGWLLTTNSDQVAISVNGITGQVNITGAHTVTMNSMVVDNSTDPPSFEIWDLTDPESSLTLDGTTEEGTLEISNYTDQTYIGNVTYTFNGTTLTITQSILTDINSSATVTISGSISFSFINTNIPANTPTLVHDYTTFPENEELYSITVEFRSDGTATFTDVYDGGTDTENWTYTTNGNQLTINDEFGETWTSEYSVNGNTLTWTIWDFEDYCDLFDSRADCLTDAEKEFDLTAGSLTNLGVIAEYLLSQVAAKQGVHIGRNYNLINPTKVITDYKLKID